MPGQSPPANVVAFTFGAADGTPREAGAVVCVVVSATKTVLVPPALPEEVMATVTEPMMATAPAAATSDSVFTDMRIESMTKTLWTPGLPRIVAEASSTEIHS